jgi:Xaa-Pro aminopeptidase
MLNEIRKQFGNFKALFISSPTNIYYLTGFTGSRGLILITKRKAYFFTDFRYLEYAKKIVPKEFTVVQIDKKWKKDWPKLMKKLKIDSLGFEEHFLTVYQRDSLKKISKSVRFKKSGQIIENIRKVKSQNELRLIKKSQQINEEILTLVKKFIKVGKTEKEIEWFILEQIHKKGADGPSFNPIVAFGNHSSVPHHQNSNRKLKKGDVVLIDMGVIYKKYCSDMTRTFFTKPPTKLQEKVYKTTLEAQKKAIKMLKAGITNKKINKVALGIIEKAGFKKNFQHAIGHGVGLDIHELPNLGAEKSFKLEENMIATIEPGIYLEKNFGVRIEDMVIISGTGYTNITKAPKELKDAILKI